MEDESFAFALQLEQQLNAQGAKEPKKKKEECSVIPLSHGVILFKNCLTIDEQLGIFQLSMEIHKEFTKSNGPLAINAQIQHPISVLTYNWPGMKVNEIPKPTDLLQFGVQMFNKAAAIASEITIPESDSPDFRAPKKYNPVALNGILYSENGKLQSHQDGVYGWVLSISIGNSADFFFSTTMAGEKVNIRLDSGDAIIFNGQKLFHGVEKIYPQSAPNWWREGEYKDCRYNLQFRDPSKFNK